MLFEKFEHFLPAFAESWFKFVERLMITGLIGYAADKTGFWVFDAAFVFSALLIAVPIGRAFLELFRKAFELLPWNRFESFPKAVAYPVAIVGGLFGAVIVCTGYQALNAGIIVTAQLLAKLHAALR